MCCDRFSGRGTLDERAGETSFPPDDKALRAEMRQVERKRRLKKAAPKDEFSKAGEPPAET